jgi:precorrin-6Y C5,15-methyltransferase (decarboxylating)
MIHVIGLGLKIEHLLPEIRQIIREAALVGGGSRLLERLDIPEEQRLPFTTVAEFTTRLKEHEDASICVIADGDPLLFGIGATLLRYFPAKKLVFHPNISAMQTACARFGLPWHDCRIISLHGRNDPAPLFAALTHAKLTAVYTGPGYGPADIARLAVKRGVTGWHMHVAEALDQPMEHLETVTLVQAAGRTWKEPNIVLLERMTPPDLPLCLGLADDDLAHQDGLMTKFPVRATALSLLRLQPDSILWDLGAGSGAVSLEAARLITRGRIIAVEREDVRIQDIRTNMERTGAWIIQPVPASIEDFLDVRDASDTTRPDRIFLGGGVTAAVLEKCGACLAPGGRLVATAVLLSTLDTLRRRFEAWDWEFSIHQLMHHQSRPLGRDLRLIPANPVFLVEARKPDVP